MQLRRLDLHGFKTFANATTLEFSPGITAIVGPNGSGKSNVADAIIWSLGEGNVRALRGGKLLDVVFAGSANRRPTGLAEVSLTFDNASRTLPLDFAEVSVTRRIYRSDESEFFINRTACRLRDIVDLFLDTGIGKESYFALNQGEIDMILSANPDERRTLFEEAAGIKKYRVRKRESLRKLETTEQNLLRIHDLMSEVESRVGPLQRQAESALRYRELSRQLRNAELAAFAADWSTLSARLNDNSAQLSDARARETGVLAELSLLAAEEENVRLALHAADEALEAAHRRSQELSEGQARSEGRITVLQERLKAGAAASDRARGDLAAITGQQDEVRRSAAITREELGTVEVSLREIESALSQKRQELTGAETTLRSRATALDEAQSREVARAARRARAQADSEAAELRIQSLQERRLQLDQNLQELTARRSALNARKTGIVDIIQDARARETGIRAELEQVQNQLFEAQSRLTALVERARSRESEMAGQSSRLRLLEEQQNQREGFFKGVRTVLQAQSAGTLPGHYKAVADVLTVGREYEAAIEAALGGSAQDIITTSDAEARSGIDFLKRTGAGRATFLSLELVSHLARGGSKPNTAAAGILGIASELVQFDALYRPIAEMLLGRVLVVDTLENGNSAARRLSGWSRMVTLDGEVISSQGAMTGGSRQQGRSAIVGRSGQISELRISVATLRKEIEDLAGDRKALQQEIDRIRDQVTALEQTRQQTATEGVQRTRDLEHQDQEERRIEREEQTLRAEIDKAQARLTSEHDRRVAESLPDAAGAAETDFDHLRARSREAAAERDRVRDALSQLQANEAGLRERRRSLAAAVEQASIRLSRLDTETRRLTILAEGSTAGSAEIAAELSALEQQALDTQGDLESARRALQEVRSSRELTAGRLEAIAEQTRQANRRQQEQAHAVFNIESGRATISAEMQRIHAVLVQDYELVDLAAPDQAAEPAGPDQAAEPARPDQAAPEPAGSDQAAPGPAGPGPDAAAVSRRVSQFLEGIEPSIQPEKDRVIAARLRRQMRALEPVNLEAIEEAEQVVERLTFLKDQRADIESAARDLKAVIGKIDLEARDRFMTTFQAIGIHFDELFRQLFGGGQTRLFLTDPGDPTESGIEISAQPPGKKLQTLQLLSGGERSLTAVALLFAMLRVRPVPFCIMDEVDAALDEANIARFGEMVQEFAKQTQFIIITHNRGTMEIADQLYGVTMTEPGVSRILSLKLAEAEAHVNGRIKHPLDTRK